MALTESQKKANKKYRDKRELITVSVQYNTDLRDGQRLKQYLSDTGQSANAYIKSLIKRDLDAHGIPYPAADNPTPLSDSNNDALSWDNDNNAPHSSGSAWDVLEQIARENGYKG